MIAGVVIHKVIFLMVFLLITTLGLHEFYKLTTAFHVRPQFVSGIGIGLVVFLLNFLVAQGMVGKSIFLLLLPLFVVILVTELFREHVKPFANIAITIFGILYVAMPFSLFNYFVSQHCFVGSGESFLSEIFHKLNCDSEDPLNSSILLGYFFLMWTNDAGAYFVGTRFGQRRLFERISPKKSWEGSIGGAIFSLLLAVFLSHVFNGLSLVNWLVIATLVVVVGTLGDLVESMLKRSIEVKDSGSILPGHGGILDRFDSILLSAPIIFMYLQLLHVMN